MGHFVYMIGFERNRLSEDKQLFKVGHAKNVAKRMSNMQTANHEDLALLGCFKFSHRRYAVMAEKIFHTIADNLRVRGEWVYTTPLVPKTTLKILQDQGDKLELWFDQAWLEEQHGPHQNHQA